MGSCLATVVGVVIDEVLFVFDLDFYIDVVVWVIVVAIIFLLFFIVIKLCFFICAEFVLWLLSRRVMLLLSGPPKTDE